MGETRVDLLRLLEDLRDAYPGSIEETILTEVVANALDSGARQIAIFADSVAGTCTVIDDGKGMSRAALSRYHDLAVTSKRRGRGIGFAGVGIKLGLLVCDEVVTETRTPRVGKSLATSWRLSSRKRAPWRWIEPPGVLQESGTAVRLYLSNTLSRLLDAGFIEQTLLQHFQPLFHPEVFGDILAAAYPEGVRFEVNGRAVPRTVSGPGLAPLQVKVGRQRKPSGVGFLAGAVDAGGVDAGAVDLADDERGIAVSTLGKVIKRGWDWIGLTPAQADGVGGLIEIPALAESLTLNKADFIRTGTRGATFLAYRKVVQEAVSAQLEEWGEGADASPKTRRRTRSLERDLQSVLADLSDEYPLLATLVERRPGGQRRLPLGGEPSSSGVTPGVGSGLAAATPEPSDASGGPESAEEPEPAEGPQPAEGPEPGEADSGTARSGSSLPGRKGRRRPAHYGLTIRFETRPEDERLGRLVENTVWVNDAHPAYRRAAASRAEGYHVSLTAAMALASLAVEPHEAQAFVTEFLARWGNAGRVGKGR